MKIKNLHLAMHNECMYKYIIALKRMHEKQNKQKVVKPKPHSTFFEKKLERRHTVMQMVKRA